MLRLRNIAILVDKTPDAALRLADKLAAIDGASVHLFSIELVRREYERQATGLDADATVTVGLEKRFLRFLDESKVDLAIASHEHMGWWSRLTDRNITGEPTRRSRTPILAVGAEKPIGKIVEHGIRSAMVAATCESEVFAAIAYGAKLGTSDIHLVFAKPDNFDFDLDAALRRATTEGPVNATVIPIDGSFVPELFEKAKILCPDIFIVGSKPHTDSSERLFGTTSDRLLGLAEDRPVLVIPKAECEFVRASHQLDDALATGMPASDPLPVP